MHCRYDGPHAVAPEGDMEQTTAERAEVIFNLRARRSDSELIDRAAAALHKTRTEFMLDSSRREAMAVLLDRRHFVLDEERWAEFAAALEEPPRDNPRLKRLLSEKAPWEE
jgi:uncharacterized protein (DUF1778 family)